MAKANINSEDQLIPNDNKGRTFFSVSTIENESSLEHVRIFEHISEDEYNKIKIDDVVDSQGDPRVNFSSTKDGARGYFRLIKDGENYSPYADEGLQKILEKKGNNSFTKQLELSSQDAIVSHAKENNFSAEAQESSFWGQQQTSLKNLAGQASDFVSNLAEELGKVKITFEGNRRKEYENLYYPETITTSKQDRIRFSMRYISGSRTVNFDPTTGIPLGLGQRNTTSINGSVTLPIPGGISDSNSVKFDNDSLDMLGAIGFGAILNPAAAAAGGTKLLKDALDASPDQLREALGGETGSNLISALRIRLAEMGMSRTGMFSRIGGGILNPNMELLFQAPQMRTFKFSFTMSARSRTEATQIKKIIRFFKQGMSVKRSRDNIFIVSPNTFTINYILGNTGNDHPSIGRIKECALTELNTTYGNGSTYMTFDDPERTLTTYKIDMAFSELDPITEDDYDNSDDIAGIENELGIIQDNHVGY